MIINPIHVRAGEAVDIHWHTRTGIFIERRTVPPEATVDARKSAGEDAPSAASAAPADGQAKETDRPS